MPAPQPALPLRAPRPAGRRALAAADFDSFYQANYAGTVAVAFGLTGDRGEAQDLAQEAYCRAWQRWPEISAYDNPGAWVYRVTVNLARSRWRNLRTAAAHLLRMRPVDVAPADPEHVALVTALRALPMDQRQAIVLHHLVDLPVNEVAREMGVPAGTVKSWLHRGRTELAALLGEHSRGGEPVPPDTVRQRGDRRRRARNGTLAAAAAAVCALVAVFAIRVVGPVWPGPTPPAQTPSPSPSQSPSAAPSATPLPSAPPPSPAPVTTVNAGDPILKTDWRRTTITVPAAPDCPSGQLTFRTRPAAGGFAPVAAPAGYPRITLDVGTVVYGDLTGDGAAEAVLGAACWGSEEDSGDGKSHQLVVTREAGGRLRALGWVGDRGAVYPGIWVADQVLYLEMHPWHGDLTGYRIGMAYGFRWTGKAFAPVDVSAAYPPVVPTVAGRRLDLTPVAGELRCNDLPPPAGELRPVFDADGVADGGDREWTLMPGAPSNGPYLVRLNPARPPYLLLRVSCAVDDTPGATADVQPSENLVLFDLAPDGWRALTRVPTPPEDYLVSQWRVVPGGLSVDHGRLNELSRTTTFRWNGTSFTR
ncbi:SigE family RNA polymerase sigma factor [Catellatospora bangladeshensis]|nr:SigE family RNA polymerase sigma factor [Catellatospora bangladeshensis]